MTSLSSYKIHPTAPILGLGNHGIVFYVSDRKREFALKVECEIELEEGKEVNMKELELLSKEAFDKLRQVHVLDHVVQIYNIWSVKPDDFFRWAKAAWDTKEYQKFVSFHLTKCKENLVVILMEKVDDDLGKEIAEKEAFIPTASIVFDLYWSFLSMLSHDIIPKDIHPGNIGLSETEPITYKMCNLTAVFGTGCGISKQDTDDVIGVKLIDYTYYQFKQEGKCINPLDIKHGKIMEYMNNAILSVIEEDERALQVWTFLKKVKRDVPAIMAIYEMLTTLFKENLVASLTPEKTLIIPSNQPLCNLMQRSVATGKETN